LVCILTPHKAIDEIYKLDPKSEQLDLLLVRLVNMEEEKFNGNVYEKAKREEYKCNKETISIINKIASANNTSNPSLWNLAAAYINYASRDFKVGAAYLAQAEKGKDKSELFNAQYHIIKLFGNLYAAGEINEKTEKLLLPDIKILFDTKTMNIKSARTLFAQNWTRSTLSYLYAQKGEYEKAEMIYAGSVKNYFS
jgi:hypothetical protein